MGTYVENLKKLLDDVKADMPNPPSRDTGDVIEGIFSITKTNEIEVQNPTKAVNKGEHLKKGDRLKSEREKAITGAKKKVRPCGFIHSESYEHYIVESYEIHCESHEIHCEFMKDHSESFMRFQNGYIL
ncbi:hypothetical protein Tco_0936951 [Tanacetum coccineum]|uniref:Uncharacterized protein n=1 Tax=Tanacetum coccineum TaxID=301880 RepID=A0ABQ5DCY4_9ASTR